MILFLLNFIPEETFGKKREYIMHKIIEAIYENGVLKPLTALDIKEHEKVEVIIREKASPAKMSQGIVKGDPEVIEDVALNPEYSCLEE